MICTCLTRDWFPPRENNKLQVTLVKSNFSGTMEADEIYYWTLCLESLDNVENYLPGSQEESRIIIQIYSSTLTLPCDYSEQRQGEH